MPALFFSNEFVCLLAHLPVAPFLPYSSKVIVYLGFLTEIDNSSYSGFYLFLYANFPVVVVPDFINSVSGSCSVFSIGYDDIAFVIDAYEVFVLGSPVSIFVYFGLVFVDFRFATAV